MSSCRLATVLENSLIIALLLSEDDLMHFATFELFRASHGGLRTRKPVTSVSQILGDLDSAPGDPAIDPLRIDVEMLGNDWSLTDKAAMPHDPDSQDTASIAAQIDSGHQRAEHGLSRLGGESLPQLRAGASRRSG
jgi:hypothetical protein